MSSTPRFFKPFNTVAQNLALSFSPTPHPQNIFPSIQIDANGNVNGLFHDLALAADVVVNGVQEHYCINRLQRPLLPLFCDGKDLVRDRLMVLSDTEIP